jgi:uncharacterized protein YjiS (DUF1127 family)
MTDFSIPLPRAARSRAILIERLRTYLLSREERRLAIAEMQRLYDRTLLDVGIERHDIATLIDKEMTRIGLRELGPRGLL